MIDLAGDQLVGDFEQVDVVGFHQRVDLAEGQQVAAAFQPQHGEHRLRPEDAAAGKVPVPQAAAAAVERGVDAPAHRVVDQIAFARAGGLPVEGEAEDQHDEACRGRQRHRQRRVRSPDRLVPLLDHDDLAGQRLDDPLGSQRAASIRQDHVGDRVLRTRRGEQLGGRDHVEYPVGLAEAGFKRHAGEDALVGADDDDVAAAGAAPGRDQAGQDRLQALDADGAILADRGETIDALGENVRQRRDVALDGGALLPDVVDHLHEGAEADRDEEGDDQGGHGPAQRRLGGQEPVIGRLRNRLRQSFNGIGLDARVRRMRTRHALDPRRNLFAHRFRKYPTCFRITVI